MKSIHLIHWIFYAALLSSFNGLSGQSIDLESDLILHLPFDGNALDVSGENVPTNVMGPVLAEDRFGKPNSAYLFDGINDSIDLNNNSPIITTKVFSMCFWAKINGQSLSEVKSNLLFEQRDDKSERVNAKSTIGLSVDNNMEIVYSLRSSVIDGTDPLILRAATPPYHEWHFYVVTLDAQGAAKIYLDALLVQSGTFIKPGDFITSVDHVNIGTLHYRGVVKGAFNGVVDEIRFYSRALNYCEIDALYSGQQFLER